MNDRDFMRYSRQILLEDIAIDGQQKLLASRVLIVGLGGLGAPAALYLAGAGIGTLVLADDDEVHLSNLQRQILFTTEDINQPKAQITRQRLHQLNPDIELIALQERLGGESLHREVALADVVLTPPWTQGCYRCLWPDDAEPTRNCRTAGILGPVVGVMGTMQALEAIKLLSGMETERNTLRLFDARSSGWRHLALHRASHCPVCGGRDAHSV